MWRKINSENISPATLQQRLSCIFCQDCHGGNSEWISRDCDNEDPVFPPTTPGPIFPMAAQILDSNDTTTTTTTTTTSANPNNTAIFVDPSWQNWQCFSVTYNANGRERVSRGCVPFRGSHQATCDEINQNAVWCVLCDDRDNCNSSSHIYISMIVLISSLLFLLKLWKFKFSCNLKINTTKSDNY